MPGDYVAVFDCIAAKVAEIHKDEIIASDGRVWDEDEIKAIPLTPEILEKIWAGKWTEHSKTIKSFIVPIDEHSNILFQAKSGSCEVFVVFHRCGADSCEFTKNIKYVHELQHALKLCGIDKEITL